MPGFPGGRKPYHHNPLQVACLQVVRPLRRDAVQQQADEIAPQPNQQRPGEDQRERLLDLRSSFFSNKPKLFL
jgi:hypothetical protein